MSISICDMTMRDGTLSNIFYWVENNVKAKHNKVLYDSDRTIRVR